MVFTTKFCGDSQTHSILACVCEKPKEDSIRTLMTPCMLVFFFFFPALKNEIF